jgi:pSer/pThr/pTyr-binding forkhead associated (FHA) protein/CRP-like cAMP-binding protein/Fe-S-cluster-containing dehydrogenase component
MIRVHVEGTSGRSFHGPVPVVIGRDPACDLVLDDEAVSRKHLLIRREGRDYVAEDQKSTNGTFLAGPNARIECALLRSGDVLLVGKTRLRIELEADLEDTQEDVIRFSVIEPESVGTVFESRRERITIGRDSGCDVVLPDPTVSRRHAVVVRTPSGFVISDQKSTNAIFLGNPPEQITAAHLYDGEEIRLGSTRLHVEIPGETGQAPELTHVDASALAMPLEVPYPKPGVLQARLARTPLFKAFTDEDWRIFLSAYERDKLMRVDSFRAGETVSQAGKFDLSFYVVLDGMIDAFDPLAGRERLMSYRAGDFFGLTEAKRALARATTLRAGTDAYVFRMPRAQLRRIEHNPAARALLEARHKEEAWRVMAAQLELFRGVSSAVVAELIERSEIVTYDKPGIVIVRQGTIGDSFHIVRDGFLQVVQRREDGTDRVLAYLRPGEFFGERALLDDVPRAATVSTAGKAEVVRISRQGFRELCSRHPEVERRVRNTSAERERAAGRMTTELSQQLQQWGQGYVQADALLVMDLELCVKCDLCVEACQELHGESRLVRRGMQLGTYLVPSACRHCDDPLCMFACPTAAVKRRPEGEIYIQYDLCIGCGACAIACPYDNIEMIETNKFDQAQARKQAIVRDQTFFRPHARPQQKSSTGGWRGLLGIGRKSVAEGPLDTKSETSADESHPVPPRYPIKCDLCDGLPFMGCVHTCPTGAAMRVDPRTILQRTGAVSVGSRINKARAVTKG